MTTLDTIRILRIYSIEGPRHLVERQLHNSLQGPKRVGGGVTIKPLNLASFDDGSYERLQPPTLTKDELIALWKNVYHKMTFADFLQIYELFLPYLRTPDKETPK